MRYYYVTNACHLTSEVEALLWTTIFTDEGGMDIPQILEQVIQKSMEGLLQAESEQNLGGGRSTVVLFVPYTAVNLNNNDLQIAKDKVKHIREYLPGQYRKMYRCRQVTWLVQPTNFSLLQTVSSTWLLGHSGQKSRLAQSPWAQWCSTTALKLLFERYEIKIPFPAYIPATAVSVICQQVWTGFKRKPFPGFKSDICSHVWE